MKKMKKFLIGALAMLMSCAGFVACSGGDTNESSNSSSVQKNSIEEHIHSYTEEIIKEPTCLEKGAKTFSCVCGDNYTEEISALGHDYENYICIRCGVEILPSEGLEYELNSDNVSYAVVAIGNCKDTDVAIPSVYNDLPVTRVGNTAFKGCDSLTSVNVTNR